MNEGYKLYHPRWHRRRIPIFWWLGKLSYTKFIVRELTSLAVLYAAGVLLVQTWTLSRGPESYQRFQEILATPAALLVHTLILAPLLLHTLTWLGLAPQAMVVQLGKRRVPNRVVLLAHYLAWFAVSAFLVWGLVGR